MKKGTLTACILYAAGFVH